MSVGERLTLLRKALDINQTDMAMVMGCTQANISYFEKEGNMLSAKYLILLGETYSVNLNWLLLGIGEMFMTDNVVQQPAENQTSKEIMNPKKKNKAIKKISELSAESQRISQELQELRLYLSE